MGHRAIHASSSLLAIAIAHKYPHRFAVIRRSVAFTTCPYFYNKNPDLHVVLMLFKTLFQLHLLTHLRPGIFKFLKSLFLRISCFAPLHKQLITLFLIAILNEKFE